MAKIFNRAKMTTATTGAGTVTLGTASVGFQTFADAGVSNNDVVQYVIEEGANFEIGTGTYTATGTSLTRTPTETSNSNNAITLGGNATVSVTAIDDDFNRLEHAGVTKVAVTATGASVTGDLAVSGTIPAGQLTGAMPAIDGSALTGIVSIPTGLIAMWSGTNASIPSGWNLCDGNNSTPNLTDRFILGRAAGTNTGGTGGANTVTISNNHLPSHTHSSGNLSASAGGDHSHNFNTNTGNSGNHTHSGYTSNTGNHNHNINFNAQGDAWGGTPAMSVQAGNLSKSTSNTGGHSHNIQTYGGGDHSHNFNANTGNSGNHTHSIGGNTGASGSGSAMTITPVYYTLAFIMKS
tara:strand:+ start:1047 stop:2099 length:1053 start_codon:yes stop_codon:yes gene_type:complete